MLKGIICIKPIQVITISHRLLMLKMIYIKMYDNRHPTTQITHISILINIQLMFSISTQ